MERHRLIPQLATRAVKNFLDQQLMLNLAHFGADRLILQRHGVHHRFQPRAQSLPLRFAVSVLRNCAARIRIASRSRGQQQFK